MTESSILVDGVQAMGVHNDVVRLQLTQIQADGKQRPELELQIPIKVVRTLIEALNKSIR